MKYFPAFNEKDFNMGGSRIFGKGVHMYKHMGVRFVCFLSHFLKYSMKLK